MNKKIIFISLCICLFVMSVILVSYKAFEDPIISSLPKYYASDCYYGEGFQDYTDYCKYYFAEDSSVVENLKKNKYFNLVTDGEVEYLEGYFENFESRLVYEEYKSNYDFVKDSIDTFDYFYVENKYTFEKYADYPDEYSAYNLYFFDTQTKTLFFIHSNI